MKPLSRVLLVAAVAAAGWLYFSERAGVPDGGEAGGVPAAPLAVAQGAGDSGAEAAQQAFQQKARGVMLQVRGRVTRILADDRDGSPHQRFIIATNRGQTLLVAHNLDLAPRLEGLQAGEEVTVFGEYEWNAQGGVMHWTHDDPAGNHVAGYVQWRGRKYQ